MRLFKASAWRNFHSIHLLGNSNQKVFSSRPFMEILTSASQHQHSHWHRHCKKSCFCLQNLLFKNRVFMLFLVLSYGISTTLLQILTSLRFPIHLFKGVYWCCRKRLFEHSEASVRWFFKKTTAPKISAYFAYFPAKHPGWSSF